MEKLFALDIAKYFLTNTNEEQEEFFTNLKLQKLCYYAQGFQLALYGEPLFSEKIYAWQYGPVVKDLYHALQDYGHQPIPVPESIDLQRYPPEVRDLLNEVYNVYGQFSAARLVELTHSEPPWKETLRNEEISLDLMQNYFQTLVVDGKN